VKVFCPDSKICASLPSIICDSIQLKHPLLGRNWLDVLYPSWRKSVCTASFSKQSFQEIDHVSLFTTRFPKVFSSDSSSAIVGFSVNLSLKPNAIPKFCSPYSLPFALQDIMSAMLTKLEQEGKLIKVDRSEWASPIFLVPKKKNGQYRLCVDLKKTLNPSLCTDVYALPTLENIFAKLNGGAVFCVLDLSEAYTQLKVNPESQKLLTVNTHKSLFQFTRLVYGISSAPALFQKFIDTLVQGIPNTVAYLDDILIQGSNFPMCLDTVTLVLQKLNDHNVRIQPNKCLWFKSSVEYLGHVISEQGRAPSLTQAIVDAPVPTNV